MSDAAVIVAAVTGAAGAVAALVVLRGRKSRGLASHAATTTVLPEPLAAHEEPTSPVTEQAVETTPELPESETTALTVESPAPARGRMRALAERLGRSNSVFGGALLTLLSDDSAADTDWESVEDTLIMADLGVKPTADLVASLRRTVKPKDGANAVRAVVREQLLDIFRDAADYWGDRKIP
ncbi:MAG: hypothetical protein EBU85_07475, partial [Actinobacteria bacterium]|nr:hypothetical protein [Actinomycetota bacterium]